MVLIRVFQRPIPVKVLCLIFVSSIGFFLFYCFPFLRPLNAQSELIALSPSIQSIIIYRKEYLEHQNTQFLPPTRINELNYHVPILMYHYISISPDPGDTIRIGLSTSPWVFEKQLQEMTAAGFTSISLDDMFDAMAGRTSLPPKPVILTFDDAYTDFYWNAYPLLLKYHMKGTVFVPTGFVGFGHYLTWKQIEEMDATNFITFGAHTVHHISLPSVSQDVAVNEIHESKREIENHVKHTVHWFAYPYGTFNERVVKEVRSQGFYGAVTTMQGSSVYESRLFYIERHRAGGRTGRDLLSILE
jgi:peptidoglycan/xylan/chitin deacetylase (PgdA/CDA1 family)